MDTGTILTIAAAVATVLTGAIAHLWRAVRAETKASRLRLEKLEEFHTTVLMKLVADQSKLMATSNQVISESTRTIEAALRILERQNP